ncbi:hypothetical protein IAR55_006070 [Kwoniella newhampshirensis]|uniref:Zn(2)-C6 fungal-type domain-containing protein n=1 Tax=Kwoniella newhampshirensis TaxID=1651941 RepID=A0AAW0YEZ1_9TREE
MSSAEDDRRGSMPPAADNLEPLGAKKRRRNVDHVTKACDSCRTKKTRCDGVVPICGPCSRKGIECTSVKTDGRKKRGGNGNIREKLDDLMSLLRATQPAALATVTIPILSPEATGSNPASENVVALPTSPSSHPPICTANSQTIHSTSSAPEEELFSNYSVAASGDAAASNESLSPYRTEALALRPTIFSNDRLKYGPTSFWSYAPDASQGTLTPQSEKVDLRPGEWVDWAQHLPHGLNITKNIHDAALNRFGAYYAPWCMAVDMPAFLRDLEACNLVSATPTSSPTAKRTSSYSPLLHNCALLLGLHFSREIWPDLATTMSAMLPQHCSSMVTNETDDPNLSTPRALALYAACLNLRTDKSAHNIGYIHFGMAFACVQALGVNLKCDHLVDAGSGRPCMTNSHSDIPLPSIETATDDETWPYVGPGNPINGAKSMRSTVFHWSARLACILRQVVDIALSTDNEYVDRDSRVEGLLAKLESWYRDQPFRQPKSHPVPHILMMHMVYHLTVIYLLRPYFRAALSIDPSPAQRCEQAADAITELLTVFDGTHGLRNSVASITYTWIEARRAFEIIKFLRSEWLPFSPPAAEESLTSQANVGINTAGEAWGYDEFVEMLQDCLSRDGVYGASTLNLPQTCDIRS